MRWHAVYDMVVDCLTLAMKVCACMHGCARSAIFSRFALCSRCMWVPQVPHFARALRLNDALAAALPGASACVALPLLAVGALGVAALKPPPLTSADLGRAVMIPGAELAVLAAGGAVAVVCIAAAAWAVERMQERQRRAAYQRRPRYAAPPEVGAGGASAQQGAGDEQAGGMAEQGSGQGPAQPAAGPAEARQGAAGDSAEARPVPGEAGPQAPLFVDVDDSPGAGGSLAAGASRPCSARMLQPGRHCMGMLGWRLLRHGRPRLLQGSRAYRLCVNAIQLRGCLRVVESTLAYRPGGASGRLTGRIMSQTLSVC